MKSTASLLTLSAILIVAGCAPFATAEEGPSEPGRRPDLKPSSLEFWSSLESKTLDQIRRVKETQLELEKTRTQRVELIEKRSNAEEGPWWSPFDDEKTRMGKQIERMEVRIKELEEQSKLEGSRLQDYLSSTPGGRAAPELEFGEYRLNKEAIEIRNALENLQALGRRLVAEIRANPKDIKKASECYDAQLRALGYIQLMHTEFARRCQEDYPKYLDDLDKATAKFIQKQQTVLLQFDGQPEDAAIIQRTVDKARALEERLPLLRSNIVEMRKWANANLETVRNKKVVLSSLRDSADLMSRAQDIAKSVSNAFSELNFEEPPLVEFEFDPESLDLEMGGPGPIE